MGRRVARKAWQDVFDKLMGLPVSYFDRNQAGDIISRVSYDIDVVTTSLSADLIQILTSVITVGGSFLMMCLISPAMVLCLCVRCRWRCCLPVTWAKKPVRSMPGAARPTAR